jgi:hypothetical protein
MNKLWLTLFSLLFFFSCVTKPEVEELSEDEFLIKQDSLQVVYNKQDGGYIGQALYAKKIAFDYIQETFPSPSKNFRLSKSSNIHDHESIVSRTFHTSPKLSVNRAYALKNDSLELNWRFKNTSVKSIQGKFQLSLGIDKGAELKGIENGTEITLANDLQLKFIHSNKLIFKITKQGLTISDRQARVVKPSHRESEKITIHFAKTK